MSDINDLRRYRADHAAQVRALLDAASEAGRDLTSEESRECDRHLSEVDRLDVEIGKLAGEREAGRNDGRLGEPAPFGVPRGPGRSDGGSQPLTLRTSDGRRVQAAEAGDSFVRATGSKPVSELADEPNLLGRLVMEWATGRSMLTERERRDMTSGSGPDGGYLLTPDMSSELIDLMRNETVLRRAGAVFMPLENADTHIVTVEDDPELSWRSENETVSTSEPSLGQLTLRPKSIAAMATLSDELASDAPNAAETVERVLAQAAAVELDRRLFRGGDEVPSPIGAGVVDATGIGTVDLSGSAPSDYDPWLDAIELVENNNVTPTTRIDSPRTKRQLAGLKDNDSRQLPAPAEVADLNRLTSNQVPTDLGTDGDESLSLVGNLTRSGAFVIVGVRQEFRLEGTRVGAGAFKKIQVKVRISGRYDIAVARPSGLAKVDRIGPSA